MSGSLRESKQCISAVGVCDLNEEERIVCPQSVGYFNTHISIRRFKELVVTAVILHVHTGLEVLPNL